MGQILKLHNMLIKKEISAKELTQKYLSAIDNINPEINAYISVTADAALMQADVVDRKIAGGEEIDLLSGIPMTLKDNICTKGLATTCCSKILEGYTPVYDATAWKKLKDKSAVLLGKTNMDEFAMGCSSETSVYGGSKNPHNKSYVAGGSSGGSASAVAANLAVYALGSDTGGSVRQPASSCGCVGLKPTYGAVSRYGLVAYASSLDQIGVLSADVEDAAVVFDAVAGFDLMDSTSRADFAPCAVSFLNNDIKGRQLGIPKELIEKADKEVAEKVLSAAKVFESLGAEVEFFSFPELVTALPAYYVIACAEASSNLGRYDGIRYGARVDDYESIHQMICKTRSQCFGDEVKKRIMLGTFVLSEGYYDKYYSKAQALRVRLCSEFEKVFGKYDAILAPTSPKTAFKIGEVQEDKVGSFNSDLCTVPANLAGLPAVSVPCGKTAENLPVGLQIIGNKFREQLILNLANAYECVKGTMHIKNMGVRL